MALLRALRRKLHGCARDLRGGSSHACSSSALLTLSLSVAVAIPCATAFSRVVVFFLPLVASTSLCCAAVYLLVTASDSERGGAAKEVVLVCGGKAEVGILQVFDDANATVYNAGGDRRRGEVMRVGCFLHYRSSGAAGGGWTKRGVDEDGEEVVFAGRLAATGGGHDDDGDDVEEELAALQVDRLAEGVWDSYFGVWSRWNYMTDGYEYDEGAGSLGSS